VTPKQELFSELFQNALVRIRASAQHAWWRRADSRLTEFESELIHNATISLAEPAFVDADIWFLNHQARWYVENCNARLSKIYAMQVDIVRRLFAQVPREIRHQLTWPGPV
jgi:hypothetical protein